MVAVRGRFSYFNFDGFSLLSEALRPEEECAKHWKASH